MDTRPSPLDELKWKLIEMDNLLETREVEFRELRQQRNALEFAIGLLESPT